MATGILSYDGEKYNTPSRNDDHLAAVEIMNGSEENAQNILAAFGTIKFLPGTYFTTAQEIAKFYGVSERYLKSVLLRAGFTYRKTPNDAKRMSVDDLRRKYVIPNKYPSEVYYCDKSSCLCFSEKDKTVCKILGNVKHNLFYSVKVFLALSVLMLHAQLTVENSMAKQVSQAVARSAYGERAKAIRNALLEEWCRKENERRQKFEEERKLEEAREMVLAADGVLPAAPGFVAPNPNANVLISADVFKMLLEAAVRESVRQILSAQGGD